MATAFIDMVGVLMIVYVLVGGMKGTTWVQIIKACLLLGGASFMALMVTDTYGTPALMASHRAPTAHDKAYDNGEGVGGGPAVAENPNGVGDTPQTSRRARLDSMMVNAMDFYGTWKLFDALCDAAFYNKNREYALGNTPQQRFMGLWSDGKPVKELKVTDKP